MKRNLLQTFFFLLLVMHVLWSVSCTSSGYGGVQTYESNFYIKLADPGITFTSIEYSGHHIVDKPLSNSTELRIYLLPEQTQMILQTTKGQDTLVYKIVSSLPYFTHTSNGDEILVRDANKIKIMSHTFDSAYVDIREDGYSDVFAVSIVLVCD